MTDQQLNDLIEALRQKALGNIVEKTIENYTTENGKNELTNKTITRIKNDIDTQACIKLIDIELKRREIERGNDNLEKMTDQELEQEKQRLLRELSIE